MRKQADRPVGISDLCLHGREMEDACGRGPAVADAAAPGSRAKCHLVFQNRNSAKIVGRTPWSAADALVGLSRPSRDLAAPSIYK
jgi:hypothetical protein